LCILSQPNPYLPNRNIREWYFEIGFYISTVVYIDYVWFGLCACRHVYVSVSESVYLCVCMCQCVSVCAWWKEREKEYAVNCWYQTMTLYSNY